LIVTIVEIHTLIVDVCAVHYRLICCTHCQSYCCRTAENTLHMFL